MPVPGCDNSVTRLSKIEAVTTYPLQDMLPVCRPYPAEIVRNAGEAYSVRQPRNNSTGGPRKAALSYMKQPDPTSVFRQVVSSFGIRHPRFVLDMVVGCLKESQPVGHERG